MADVSTKRPAGRKYGGTLLRLGVSVAVLLLLGWFYDFSQASGLLGRADWALLLLAALAFFAIVVIEAARFSLVMSFGRIAWLEQLRLTLISGFVAQVTFGTLGGDLYRVAAMRRSGVTPAASTPWLALIRLMGFTANAIGVILAVALLAGQPLPDGDPRLAPFLTASWIAAAGVLGAGLLLSTSAWRWRDIRLLRRVRRPFAAAAEAIGSGFGASMVAAAVLSVSIVLARGEMIRLLCLSFGLDVGFAAALFVASVSAYATMIPVALGGLGLREGAIAGSLALFGTDSTLAITIALAARLVPLAVSAAGLALAWLMPAPAEISGGEDIGR